MTTRSLALTGLAAAAAVVLGAVVGVTVPRAGDDAARPAAAPEAAASPEGGSTPAAAGSRPATPPTAAGSRPATPPPAPLPPGLRPSTLRLDSPLGPDEVLALLPDNRLVAVSAADGRVTRELSSGAADRWMRFDRSPDGTRVYYVRESDAGCGTVVEVVAGAGERDIGPGCLPRVSPDGRSLAVGAATAGVVVYDLADPRRRTSYASYSDPRVSSATLGVYDLTWVAGGRRIAVQLGYEDPADLRVVDPATDRSLRDGTAVSPAGSLVEAVGRDLVIVDNCCYAEGESGELVLRNGATGRTRSLARSPRRYVVAAPTSGDRLVYASAGVLHRWDGGATAPVRIGRSDAVALAW